VCRSSAASRYVLSAVLDQQTVSQQQKHIKTIITITTNNKNNQLDQCHTCNFIHATLSRDKIASVTWPVAQLLNSHTTPLPIGSALYSVQLCYENAVNADWSIPVYATKLQCATQHVTLAILSQNKVARQNRVIKLQV